MGELGDHPKPGDEVGAYCLEQTLGAGGMATVFLAHRLDAATEKVAVKVLNPARVLPEELKRFTREYDALKRMDHPNVVRVFEAGVCRSYPWIAMEYVDGAELETLLDRWRLAPPPDRFARIEALLRQLAAGLQYVHDLGLIHRDIKPSNILVTAEGVPKLSDFGVVKDPENPGTQLTMAGRLVGTVAFMAPELIAAEQVDHRADLYALGAVLYVMLTGRRPIEAATVAGYLARHLTEVPTPPSHLDPDIPRRLERVCQRLLLKDAAHRYPNARSVIAALDKAEDASDHPLRGRDRELTQWNARIASLRDGAGGCLVLNGRRQSGRTHLLKAFAEYATNHGIPVLCALDPSRIGADLLAATQRTTPSTEPGDVLKELDPILRGKPTLLCVDDLDRAPPRWVDALAQLVRRYVTLEGEPLLVLFTAADLDDVLAPIASGTATGMDTECWEVGPIDADAIIALVRDRGVMGSVAPMLGRRLYEEYGGLAGGADLQLTELVEQGWFERLPDALKAARPLKDFRTADLPVPRVIREDLRAALDRLDRDASEVVELLALLNRPASVALLLRCSGARNAEHALDRLVATGLMRRASEEGQEVVQFVHPCMGRVVRGALPVSVKKNRHAALAQGLGGVSRRGASLEVAHHLLEAGDLMSAYPLLVKAARRAAQDGLYTKVLEVCGHAERIRPVVEPVLDAIEAARHRRNLFGAEGEALLARRAFQRAIGPLERSLAAARLEADPAAIARALSLLGRAHYRQGRFETASPLLEEVMRHAEPGAPERGPATRALADIRLRNGHLEDAEQLWEEALHIALDVASEDGEARARRGIAHLRAIQGRLVEAAEQLERAEDLLSPSGDERVRAGVLARALELDNVAGRYGRALHRAETLVHLARRGEMPERLPEAHLLQAEALWRIGQEAATRDALQQGLIFARALTEGAWEARIRAARLLASVKMWDEAEETLPSSETVPHTPLDDPPAQCAAIRAQILAAKGRAEGADLANWVLARNPPNLSFRAAITYLDAALALERSNQGEAARGAGKKALKVLHGIPGADGLRLEVLLAMHRMAADSRVLETAGELSRRILASLPPHAAKTFSGRPDVADALATIR